jgi:hypothetical protein
MCHWVRDAEFERRRDAAALPPSEVPKLRPRRLAGAVAAIAAVAAAALLLMLPAPTPATSTPQAAAPIVPSAVEQKTSGIDDGVPVTTAGKAGGGYCEHEL